MGNELFFELLKVCVGARDGLSHQYTDAEWEQALDTAEQQGMVGVLMSALERLPEGQLPSKLLLLQWIGMTQMAEQDAKRMVEAGMVAVNHFRKHGFACHILKGCAVARYYPEPQRRASGDIDIWLDGSREQIYQFARSMDKDGMLYGVNYNHVHYHLFDDIHLEAHIWPGYLCNPIHNRRFQQFCDKYRPTIDTDMPSVEFDSVYILLHCYRHFCGGGASLRQLMDYYYVLKALSNTNHTDDTNSLTAKTINELGMTKFAKGVMWVMKDVFGLEEKYLLMEPEEKEGRFIMQEVMKVRETTIKDDKHWGSSKAAWTRFVKNTKRSVKLLRHYPQEALWEPLFSVWLYAWRWSKGLLKDREEG